MAIGARDSLDKALVNKYKDRQVNNFDKSASAVSADEVMKVMGYISYENATHIQLSRRLSITCYGVKSMSANYNKYKKARY